MSTKYTLHVPVTWHDVRVCHDGQTGHVGITETPIQPSRKQLAEYRRQNRLNAATYALLLAVQTQPARMQITPKDMFAICEQNHLRLSGAEREAVLKSAFRKRLISPLCQLTKAGQTHLEKYEILF